MAKVYNLPDYLTWMYNHEKDNIDTFYSEQEKRFESLKKDPFAMYGDYMDKTDKSGVVGSIISFGVADGGAHYLVIAAKPLKVCHIPYMDGYHADPILLRGLRLSDVVKRVNREKLFA